MSSRARVFGVLALLIAWSAVGGALVSRESDGLDAPPPAGGASTLDLLATLPEDPRLTPTLPTALPTAQSVAQPDEKPRSIDGLRVAVPRLGIDLPLAMGELSRDVPRPGYAGATPERVALVYPEAALPGDAGNTYIYAHARVGMFLALWNARLDDLVLVLRDDGAVFRSYRIALIMPRVDPGDTRWLDPRGDERLTLQTSTGPRADDPRFIAVAYPVRSASGRP